MPRSAHKSARFKNMAAPNVPSNVPSTDALEYTSALQADVGRLRAEHAKLPLHASHTRNQKRIAAQADVETERTWYRNMRGVLNEVDWDVFESTGVAALPTETPELYRFLDLGCCPGGFSSYVLEKNPRAIGVGVSLADGHNYLLEQEDALLAERHTLLWLDLVRLRLAPLNLADQLVDPPAPLVVPEQHDLVILDGHPLPVQKEGAGRTNELGSRLLVSQLIIALQTVRTGGTLIVKLVDVERPDVQRIILALDALSEQLVLTKPRGMFAIQDSFYVVARGIRAWGSVGLNGQVMLTREQFLRDLRITWRQLMLGLSVKKTRWNFICSSEVWAYAYSARYADLTKPVLEVLHDALAGRLAVEKNGGM